MSDTELLPFIVADDKLRAAEERRQRVADHIESMACCWEEWDGNQGIKVGTRIELGSCSATLAEDRAYPWKIGVGENNTGKAGTSVYCYMAPAKVVEVVDTETFIAEIQYPTGTDSEENRVSVEWMNGTKLRLDILEVWPPVQDLIRERNCPF
jgi:hypothetical protein